MCGRFVLAINPQQLALEFGISDAGEVPANYNVAPTQLVPTITNEKPETLTLLRWGLIPSWSKDPSIGARMINARSETVDEKPAFRAAFKRRRCVIPANGFYEWQKHADGKKTPTYIQIQDREVFGFAGLWEVWHSPDGDELHTCTILTTEANAFMKPIHDRMPVILHRDDYADWLTPGEARAVMLKSMLRPYEDDQMIAYAVSNAVNRAGYSSPELIEPVDRGRLL